MVLSFQVKKDQRFPVQRSNSMENLSRRGSLPKHLSTSPNIKHRNQVHRRSISEYLADLGIHLPRDLLSFHHLSSADVFSSSKLKPANSEVSDKTGVKNRLKKFINRRPSMKTLQEKGLIKGG